MSATNHAPETPKGPPLPDAPSVARQVDERIEMLQSVALAETATSDGLVEIIRLNSIQRQNLLQQDYCALRDTMPSPDTRVNLAQDLSEVFYKMDKSIAAFSDLQLRVRQAQVRERLASRSANKKKPGRGGRKRPAK
jgi:hypothetical protein